MNISLVVHDSEARKCVRALHSAFFANDLLSEFDAGLQNGLPFVPVENQWYIELLYMEVNMVNFSLRSGIIAYQA